MNNNAAIQRLIDKGLLVILSGDPVPEKKRQLDQIQKEIQELTYKEQYYDVHGK